MDDMDWDVGATAEVLAERYGMEVGTIELVPMGTDTVNRRVLTAEGRRLFVKQYKPDADLDAARAAWDMSEYCRAADLPVPRVWPDEDSDLVTVAEGSAWAVVDEVHGRVATSPMTVPRAERIGRVLGRMHRVLAAYPLPRMVQQSRWRTGAVEDAVAKCGTVLVAASGQNHDAISHLRDQLDQRRRDLETQVFRLRGGLPEYLVEQALHADFARPNILLLNDAVTGVIDFRAAQGFVAWELGRAAFDPRTIATSDQWSECALAMISAYRSENPTLPIADVLACPRIALLYMLFSFYGATTAECRLPHEAEVDLKRHWAERQTSIRRLLDRLDDLEDALRASSDRPGERR